MLRPRAVPTRSAPLPLPPVPCLPVPCPLSSCPLVASPCPLVASPWRSPLYTFRNSGCASSCTAPRLFRRALCGRGEGPARRRAARLLDDRNSLFALR
jgi:hypothetical protein